jgi:hypothetical protein
MCDPSRESVPSPPILGIQMPGVAEYCPLLIYVPVQLGHAWDMHTGKQQWNGSGCRKVTVNLCSCHVTHFGPEYRYVWIRVDRDLAFDHMHVATRERMNGWVQHQRHHLRTQMAPKRLVRFYWRPP